MNRLLKNYLKDMKLPPFQEKVFLAVSKIPPGEIRSYKWVAEQIGHPRSVRAVGRALSRNPLPFIIPCHRVIKSNHRLGGFIFGNRIKKKLLSNEGLTIKKDIVIIEKRRI